MAPDELVLEPVTLYFWPTPNGQKIAIMLEEIGEPYEVRFVDLNEGAQFDPAFLAISPNNRIPAVVDPDGPDGNPISIFESGAILQYLGRKFEIHYPTTERLKAEVDQWLFWQVGGLGPMSGQCLHFGKYTQGTIPYAIERYTQEVARLFGVIERRLSTEAYLAGDFSIADIAAFPWVRRWPDLGLNIDDYPRLKAWLERIAARPAVARAMDLGRDPALRKNAIYGADVEGISAGS